MPPKLPEIRTSLPGPEARKVLALDRKHLSPSYSRDYPFVAKRGRGSMIEDVDGNWFLDFCAGIGVTATGHCHPEVVRAIRRQSEEMIHVPTADFPTSLTTRLAEKLCAITPGEGPKKVYFGNSGTEAVEAALKLARWHTGRKNFIAFQGCFHGRTYGSLSLTSSKAVQRDRFGPFLPGVFHVPYPNPYRCPSGRLRSECEQACTCLDAIEKGLFKEVVSPTEVAAIIVEPILGEGGFVVPPPDFLPGLRELADRHGILLILDEIQTGVGRTGKMWACEHSGVIPDILVTSKGIASGMPLSAIVARAELMDWPEGAHASTFGGNPVACAAAWETLRLVEDTYISRAASLGTYLMDSLSDWPQRYAIVGEVRGKGLMVGIELVKDMSTQPPWGEARAGILRKAFERGLLLLGCGESTLRLIPPLVIEKEQIDFALGILAEALSEAEKTS